MPQKLKYSGGKDTKRKKKKKEGGITNIPTTNNETKFEMTDSIIKSVSPFAFSVSFRSHKMSTIMKNNLSILRQPL